MFLQVRLDEKLEVRAELEKLPALKPLRQAALDAGVPAAAVDRAEACAYAEPKFALVELLVSRPEWVQVRAGSLFDKTCPFLC